MERPIPWRREIVTEVSQPDAHRLFDLYMRCEFDALEDSFEAILTEVESPYPLDPMQLILFREHLLLFEETLTRELVRLGHLDDDSEVERLEQQGRSTHLNLHSQAHRLLRDTQGHD